MADYDVLWYKERKAHANYLRAIDKEAQLEELENDR